jgi:hypothetical protein
MRWRRDWWKLIEAKAAELKIAPIALIRHATLRAIGAKTEADQLQHVAEALDAALAD